MEIEIKDDTKDHSSEDNKVVKRLAILQRCLLANEVVEAKQIETQIIYIIKDNVANTKEKKQEKKLLLDTEIFLTNCRILFILKKNEEFFDKKSIHFKVDTDIKIKSYDQTSSKCTIFSFKWMGQVQYQFIFNKLEEQDKLKIESFIESKAKMSDPISHVETYQQMFLETDEKLRELYEKVVENQKILSKEQFWEINKDYQDLIKYQERDEYNIKRSYIQSLIPAKILIEDRNTIINALDQEQLRFDQFREQIYDPNKLIETQNNKSFQNYKLEVLTSGKIDKKITELSKKEEEEKEELPQPKATTHQEFQHHNIEIEEVSLSLDKHHDEVAQKKQQEMSKQEYKANILQNPSISEQNDFFDMLRSIEISPPQQQPIEIKSDKTIRESYQKAWNKSVKLLERSKPITNLIQSENNSMKQCIETYSNTAYQMREILKWIYKEKQLGEKCRSEIIEKLKNELEKIRKQTPSLKNLDKDQMESMQDLFKDLNSSFIYKE